MRAVTNFLILLVVWATLACAEETAQYPPVAVPDAADLAGTGALSRARQLPIMLVFSADDCPYCRLLEEEFLKPMLISGEYDDKVIFLRKIIPGAASRSYGIHVAQMAGVPLEVIQRADEILADLDSGEISVRSEQVKEASPTYDAAQLSLFSQQEHKLREKLKGIKLDQMTPLEALVLLDEMTRSLEEDK